MIDDLRPYPAYRAAEGGWIGQIPSHWAVRRMKYVVRETDSRSTSGKEQLLRISQYTGVTERRRADGLDEPDTRADSLIGYKRVEPNDLVINIMLAWNGSMGVSRYSGIASPAYCVYRFGQDAHPWFFHNLLRSPAYKAQIKASSTGVVESRLRLYSDDLGRIEAMLPPPVEQVAIVRFLDWANGRLERAIRAKRKVIALLNEQKQGTIHCAVTRGLDPSVPLKRSGIEWTGQIPEHWEELPLRRVATCENGGSYGHEPSSILETIPVATTAQIDRDGTFDVERMPLRGFTSHEAARYACKPGDILVVKSSGSAANVISGKCGIVRDSTPRFVFSNFLARFVAQSEVIEPEYLFLLLTSYLTKERVRRMVSTTTYPNLKMNEYRGAFLPVPSLREQQRILKEILVAVEGVHTAIARLEREIDLLREYRTSLVADVVTGKLDVRGAAARLPDDAPLDSVEDADLGDETDVAEEEVAV